jgi:hypothetical protein
MRAIALLFAVTMLASPAIAAAPSCRTAFAGCRTHAQKIRFCRAACVTTRSVCESAFISGRLERRCASRAVRVCVGGGAASARATCSTRATRTGSA